MGLKEIKEQRRSEAEARKAANKVRREASLKLKKVEEMIATLEKRQSDIVSELEDPENLKNTRAFELNRELVELQESLSLAFEDWEKLTAAASESEVELEGAI